MEKSKQPISTSTGAIITKKEMINRGDKEACTGVIRKKSYALVHFLQAYDVN